MRATETIIALPGLAHARIGAISLTFIGPFKIVRIGLSVRISLAEGHGGLR